MLPIGGLKEKLLAAKIAGMRKVLVPEENRSDVEQISREIKGGMEIIFVENMTQVLEHALVSKPQKTKSTAKKATEKEAEKQE